MSRLREALHEAADLIADAIEEEDAPRETPPPVRAPKKARVRRDRKRIVPAVAPDDLTRRSVQSFLRDRGFRSAG